MRNNNKDYRDFFKDFARPEEVAEDKANKANSDLLKSLIPRAARNEEVNQFPRKAVEERY